MTADRKTETNDGSPAVAASAGKGSEARHATAARALFLNRLRTLFNIDGYLLPELTAEQQAEFVRDPVRYLIRTDKDQTLAIWREVERRQTDKVTEEFLDRSARCAIKALMSLEATAKMLETWGPECGPESFGPPNELGQVHFGQALMSAAAESIREAFANAIKQIETPRIQPSIAKVNEAAEAALAKAAQTSETRGDADPKATT